MSAQEQNNIAEHLLKSIIDTSIDGIILIDHYGMIRQINPSAVRIFGYEEEAELIGKNISILMPERDAQQHDGYLNRYVETGERHIIGMGRELKGKRKNGEQFPFRLGVSEIRMGDEILFNGIIHDLSDQKKAEERIQHYMRNLESMVNERTREIKKANELLYAEIDEREKVQDELLASQQLYKAIAANFPNGTINVFDRDLKYVFAEGKELRALGVRPEKLLGSGFIERLKPEFRESTRHQLQKVFDGVSVNFEIEHQENTYSLRCVPLTGTEGSIDRILVVETNISRQKQLEHEMQKALESERKLNELKSRFISTASHEFRTPLSAISSSALLIGKYTKDEDQPKREKHIGRVKANVENLTNILEDFLSLEKLNEGATTFRSESFDLSAYLHDSVDEMTGSLKEGQKVLWQAEAGHYPVETDKQFLRNIVNNLISNASKYSDEGKSIHISLKKQPKGYTIAIHDEGIGIPIEDQPHLFGRFFRASNCGNVKGTGLGLHIVKRYVDMMGGEIDFESKPEKGTTFYIRIPQNYHHE